MENTLLTVLGTLIVALLTVGGVALSGVSTRLRHVETDLASAREYNRAMWAWARRQLDLYYRWRREDAPDPDPIPEED